jgi:hypothetical protein
VCVAPPVSVDGHSTTPGSFERFSQLREVVVDLPPDAPGEVRVWAHRLSPDGDSEDIPMRVEREGSKVVIRP